MATIEHHLTQQNCTTSAPPHTPPHLSPLSSTSKTFMDHVSSPRCASSCIFVLCAGRVTCVRISFSNLCIHVHLYCAVISWVIQFTNSVLYIYAQIELGHKFEREGFTVSNLTESEEREGIMFHLVDVTSAAQEVTACWASETTLGQMRSGRTLISAFRASKKPAATFIKSTNNVPNVHSNNNSNTNNNNADNYNISNTSFTHNNNNFNEVNTQIINNNMNNVNNNNTSNTQFSTQSRSSSTTKHNVNTDKSNSFLSSQPAIDHEPASTTVRRSSRVSSQEVSVVTHPSHLRPSHKTHLLDRLTDVITSSANQKKPNPVLTGVDTITIPRYMVRHRYSNALSMLASLCLSLHILQYEFYIYFIENHYWFSE